MHSLTITWLCCMTNFIALSAIATTALAASNRVSNGLIIHSSGEVAIERQNGRRVRPTSGTLIYPGDKLRTAQNGQVMVQCADLGIQAIASNANQLNSCLLAKERSKAECSKDVIKCPDRGDGKIAWNSAPIPYVISPRRTQLLNNKPILRWNPVVGATSYKLSLREKCSSRYYHKQPFCCGEAKRWPDRTYEHYRFHKYRHNRYYGR